MGNTLPSECRESCHPEFLPSRLASAAHPSQPSLPRHVNIMGFLWLNPEATECPLCRKSFTLFHRKHYCRRCCEVVCSECSSGLCHVYGSPGQSRVCDPCYGTLQRQLLKLPSSLWWQILSFMELKDMWRVLTLCRTTLHRGIPLPYRWINCWSSVFGCPASFVNEGAYGKVYHTTLLERDNMPVALKVISKGHLYSLKHYRALLREIEVQKRVRHPMAIQLLEVFHDDSCVFLVMELAKGGDAFEWVVKQRAIPETLVVSLGRDLLQFTDDLFVKHNVVHRDLKLENILLMQPSAPGRTLVFKACDFGLARFVQHCGVENIDNPLVNEIVMSGGLETFATPCGTLGYTAPELLSAKDNRPQKLGLTTECIHRLDIYSIGVMTFSTFFLT